jgi:uncharacterized protein (TIGR00251 family)
LIVRRGAEPPRNPPWLRIADSYLTIEIVARPGSSKTGFLRVESRGLVVGIGAAPEKGKANAELIALIAKCLELPRSSIAIVRGESARRKTIRIDARSPGEIANHLKAIVAPIA